MKVGASHRHALTDTAPTDHDLTRHGRHTLTAGHAAGCPASATVRPYLAPIRAAGWGVGARLVVCLFPQAPLDFPFKNYIRTQIRVSLSLSATTALVRGSGGVLYTRPGPRIHSLPKRAEASVAPDDCLICCTATWGAMKTVLKRAGIHRSTNCSVGCS